MLKSDKNSDIGSFLHLGMLSRVWVDICNTVHDDCMIDGETDRRSKHYIGPVQCQVDFISKAGYMPMLDGGQLL